jgi:hypothetical protein
MDKNDPVIRDLISGNEEFRSLFREHEELEKQLAEIDSHHYLSAEQDLERKRLQKVKLRGRDRMEELITATRGTVAQ